MEKERERERERERKENGREREQCPMSSSCVTNRIDASWCLSGCVVSDIIECWHGMPVFPIWHADKRKTKIPNHVPIGNRSNMIPLWVRAHVCFVGPINSEPCARVHSAAVDRPNSYICREWGGGREDTNSRVKCICVQCTVESNQEGK